MGIEAKIRRVVEKLTGIHMYRVLPRGVDIFQDIARSLPNLRIGMVFDVGANIGQSALEFAERFPGAQVYSFEPVAATFGQLQTAVRGHKGVRCFQVALGASQSTGTMVREGTSDLFHLAKEGDTGESVKIDTLDAFCRAQKVEHIGYLKIDTEGHDLDVLQGGAAMLQEQRVDIVQVEAGMNEGNTLHVPFESLKSYLEARGYVLFGMYEQMNEWTAGEPQLRRVNPVFMSKKLIETNRL